MIGRLVGDVVHRESDACILDVGGVGYLVHATRSSLEAWEGQDAVVVHISTQVREDAITLYGFETSDERTVFQVLLTVSGVGPKLALAALDALGADGLSTAVDKEDLDALGRISGVGRKTAKRLALELKGRIRPSFAPTAAPKRVASPADPLPLALARLDYGKSEIDRALVALRERGISDEAGLEVRLRAALRMMSGGESR